MDWVAYHRVEPIGGERWDVYVGMLRQTIAASAGVAATMDECVPVWFDAAEKDAELEFLERLVAEEKKRRGDGN